MSTKTKSRLKKPPVETPSIEGVTLVKSAEFEGLPRTGRKSGYLKYAQALLGAKEGAGVEVMVPEGQNSDKFRSYAYEGMRKAFESLGESRLVSVLMGKQRDRVMICLREGDQKKASKKS